MKYILSGIFCLIIFIGLNHTHKKEAPLKKPKISYIKDIPQLNKKDCLLYNYKYFYQIYKVYPKKYLTLDLLHYDGKYEATSIKVYEKDYINRNVDEYIFEDCPKIEPLDEDIQTKLKVAMRALK